MIFLIHGQESFLSYKNLSDTKRRFLEKHPDGYNLSVFDDTALYNLNKIRDSLKNYSLFSAKVKLVIIKDFFQQKNSAEKEKIIAFLKNFNCKISKTEHIIFFETSDISKDQFYPKIKDIASEKLCSALSNIQIEKWIIEKFSQEKIFISPQEAKKIMGISGKNLWQLNNEIEKIISWLKNQNTDAFSTVPNEIMAKKQSENNIFNTIEAIAKKDAPLSLRLLSDCINSGENELYLFSMVAYQFRILIKIKSTLDDNTPINILSKKIKIHPYALKKTIPQTNRFSTEELKKIYKNILISEKKIKKGADAQNELKQFIIDICT